MQSHRALNWGRCFAPAFVACAVLLAGCNLSPKNDDALSAQLAEKYGYEVTFAGIGIDAASVSIYDSAAFALSDSQRRELADAIAIDVATAYREEIAGITVLLGEGTDRSRIYQYSYEVRSGAPVFLDFSRPTPRR